MKKIWKLLVSGLVSLMIYVILYCLMTRMIELGEGSGGGQNFFLGCGLAILCSFFGVGVWIVLTREKDAAMIVCLILACTMLNILFNTFGPTYVDRSVSYHMAFYVVDNEELDINKMKQVYVEQMIDKRVEDELDAELILMNENGTVEATKKAKMIVPVLKYIGKITATLEEYNEFLENMKK